MKKIKMMVISAFACAPILVALSNVGAQQISINDWPSAESKDSIFLERDDLLVADPFSHFSILSTKLTTIAGTESSFLSEFDQYTTGVVIPQQLYASDIHAEGILSHSTLEVLDSRLLQSIQNLNTVEFAGYKIVQQDRSAMTSVLPAIVGLMILGFAGLLAVRRPIGAAL